MNDAVESGGLPAFISFGEALTDMIRVGPDQWKSVPGGAPWNVAMMMSYFGIASAFGGAISTDCFGDEIWKTTIAARLDSRFTQRLKKSPLLAIVHETHPPKYFFVGDDSADLYFDVGALPEGWEKGVSWAHFGGISLARPPLAERLVATAGRLHELGVRISYDPNYRAVMDESYDPILARMTTIADLVKVSEEDLRGFFRMSDEYVAFDRLRAMNPAAAYLFTRGAEGAAIYVGEKHWRALPPKIEVVDTVGAGDASLAGLLSSLIRHPVAGWDIHLRAAIAAGSGACLAAGVSPPSQETVARLAADVVFLEKPLS